MHGALFLLTLGFAYMRDAHVRIELIRDRLAPRTRIWMELIGNVLFLVPYCLLLMYWDVVYAHAAFAVNETSARDCCPCGGDGSELGVADIEIAWQFDENVNAGIWVQDGVSCL